MVKKNQETDLFSKIPWLKKTLLTGVSAAFMTEEGIRNALSELKMPKNVILSAIAQADKAKQEISLMIAKEVRSFLDRMAIEDIIRKVLAGQAIEITATIRFPEDKKGQKKAVRKTAHTRKNKA